MTAALLALALLAPPAFDLQATRLALGHPDGRDAALAALDRLPAPLRPRATASGMGPLLATVALDESADFAHRVRAVRLVPYYASPQAPVAPLLAPLLAESQRPEAVALARETAKALAALGSAGHPTLRAAARHGDPEVRAVVAASGALAADACAALQDPWPLVQRAAARGLSGDAPCLPAAVTHKDQKVALAAIPLAGRSGQVALRAPLRTVAGNARGAMPLRIEAIIALGRLGDLEPARRILKTHRAKGGIVPLADAAVRALAAHGGPEGLPLLRDALSAPAAKVQVTAAQALAQRGDGASRDAIRRLRDAAQGPARRRLDTALRRLAQEAPGLGAQPEDDAPEDD